MALREWINEGAGRWIAVLVGLGAVGGAVAVFLRPTEDERQRRIRAAGATALYVCTNRQCGSRGEMKVPYDATWPRQCPKCQQNTAVHGLRCQRCREITPDQPDAPILVCDRCGYRHDRRGMPTQDPLGPPPRKGD